MIIFNDDLYEINKYSGVNMSQMTVCAHLKITCKCYTPMHMFAFMCFIEN